VPSTSAITSRMSFAARPFFGSIFQSFLALTCLTDPGYCSW
jgi:hypothetical protein